MNLDSITGSFAEIEEFEETSQSYFDVFLNFIVVNAVSMFNFASRNLKYIVIFSAPIAGYQLYNSFIQNNPSGPTNERFKEDLETRRKQQEDAHSKRLREIQLLKQENEGEHQNQLTSMSNNVKSLEKYTTSLNSRMKEDLEHYQMKQLESEQRFLAMKTHHDLENALKNQIFQTTLLKSADNEEVRKIRRESEREKLRVEAEIADIAEKSLKSENLFKRDQHERQIQSDQENIQFQQRIQEIQEQLRRDSERMRRNQETRRRQMEEQLRQIENVLRIKVWNEAIEFNWTRRLNMLREANHEVQTVFGKMLSVRNNVKLMEAHLNHVLEAVDVEKQLMRQEINALDRMYRETGKEFLLTIKSAVEDVIEECSRFSDALKSGITNIAHVNDCFGRLSAATLRIPTLAELKTQ